MKRVSFLLAAVAFLAFATRAEEPKTFAPDDEGCIHNWLVVGPIKVDPAKARAHDGSVTKELLDRDYFEGQKQAKPKDGDKVTIDGQEMAWKAAEAAEYFLNLTKFAEDQNKPSEDSVFLGAVYITSEMEIPGVRLSIGSDDDSLWQMDGKEMIRVYAAHGIAKDQNKSEMITLKKGTTMITFVLVNAIDPASICARFIDPDGIPIKGLAVSLTPPAAQ